MGICPLRKDDKHQTIGALLLWLKKSSAFAAVGFAGYEPVVEVGAEASEGSRHHGGVVAPAGNEADVGALLPLQLAQDMPAPDGLLEPLFHNLRTVDFGAVPAHRMDVGDSSCSTVLGGRDQGLQMELPDGADRLQGSGHRDC